MVHEDRFPATEMQMQNLVKAFLGSEDGAVTVDWVVMTALIVGLQIAFLLTPMREALVAVSDSISEKVDEYGAFLE